MSRTPNYNFFQYDDNTICDLKLGNENFDILDNNLKTLSNSIKIIRNVTLSTSGWQKQGNKYRYTYSNQLIDSNCIVDINIGIEYYELSSKVLPMNKSFDGGVYLYANDIPKGNLICDIKIVKGVS